MSRQLINPPASRGFTLLELMGVLAILGILSSMLVPNVLRAIDRAAVRAEAATVQQLGEQIRLHFRTENTLPPPASWAMSLATYADLSSLDVATNARGISRVYLQDPATTPSRRVMLLSVMRTGLALPPADAITRAAQFEALWQTPDGMVPDSTSWSGWSAWSSVAAAADYLLIERINLAAEYDAAGRTFTLSLNNRSQTTASYSLTTADGTTGPAVNLNPRRTVLLPNLRSGERLELYRSRNGGSPDYTYVLSSTGKTFDFDGQQWSPQ